MLACTLAPQAHNPLWSTTMNPSHPLAILEFYEPSPEQNVAAFERVTSICIFCNYDTSEVSRLGDSLHTVGLPVVVGIDTFSPHQTVFGGWRHSDFNNFTPTFCTRQRSSRTLERRMVLDQPPLVLASKRLFGMVVQSIGRRQRFQRDAHHHGFPFERGSGGAFNRTIPLAQYSRFTSDDWSLTTPYVKGCLISGI